MGETRVAQTGVKQVSRIVRQIVVTYRLEGEPYDRTLTLTHEGEGQAVDGVVWSGPLIRKLAYLEPDGACVPVETETGKEWKKTDTRAARAETQVKTAESTTTRAALSADTEMQSAGQTIDCVWLHDESCSWTAYCTDDID